LEGIGNIYLRDGNPGEAAAYLRQALAIYQRIGAPAARRVQETLHHHGLTSTTADHPPAAAVASFCKWAIRHDRLDTGPTDRAASRSAFEGGNRS